MENPSVIKRIIWGKAHYFRKHSSGPREVHFSSSYLLGRLPWLVPRRWGWMPWWLQGHWCPLVKRWRGLRSDVKPKEMWGFRETLGMRCCETPRFFICWKFLIGEWFECGGCCKRLVLKRHPLYGNFFEFWSQQKWCQTEFMNSESGGYEWLNDGKGCKNKGEGGGGVGEFL